MAQTQGMQLQHALRIEDVAFREGQAARALFALSQLLGECSRPLPGLADLTLAIAEKVDRNARDAQAAACAMRPEKPL